MRRTASFEPARRRNSPWTAILLILLAIVIGGVIYLASVDTEVPTARMEQDVTNEILAK